MRAAKRIFERDGFLDARITDITAAAGTATGSFYKYFASKEEIFLAVVEALADEGLHSPSLEILSLEHDDLAGLLGEPLEHAVKSRPPWTTCHASGTKP